MTRFIPMAGAFIGLWLAACSSGAPEGLERATLDAAVSKAIGDPSTCVLIGEPGTGRLVYRYNTHVACGRALPSCEGAGTRTADELLKQTAKDGQIRRLSCDTLADGSRGVGWAAGPVPGKPYVYAAMMEGDRSFPGMMMADRLERAFKTAGF